MPPHTSILPPPFEGGYSFTLLPIQVDAVELQSCRPFSRAVMIILLDEIAAVSELQSCRPFSRAVMSTAPMGTGCRSRLQSCRPFSRAVMIILIDEIAAVSELRSCRPFSRAVILDDDSIRCEFQGSRYFTLPSPLYFNVSGFRFFCLLFFQLQVFASGPCWRQSPLRRLQWASLAFAPRPSRPYFGILRYACQCPAAFRLRRRLCGGCWRGISLLRISAMVAG